MSSTVSATTGTAASATPSSTSVCTSNLYDTPVQDRACAMPYGGNHTSIMSNCCRDADVVAYYDNCGLYCLALGQSVKDLQDCLFEQGAGYTEVFCRDNGNVNASATATGNAKPNESAQASVVAGGDGDKASGSGSGRSGGASSTSSANAAPGGMRAAAPAGVSTLGMTIGALLLSAATFGALQI